MAATLEAGSDVDAYCTKCKWVLAHVIIAMRGSKPARVECKTCDSVHAFRTEAPTRRATRRGTAKNEEAAKMAHYEQIMSGRDISDALKYKLAAEFTEEQVMNHKTFGVGLVTRIMSDNKIEVLFQAGTKVLVHKR